MRVHDPDRLVLRRALRTAVVMPSVFAACLLGFHDVQLATFAAFGLLAMLAFADFSGPLGSRFRAYLALAVSGAVLIAAGTLLSAMDGPAAASTAAVGFVVTFLGVLGGYVAAGRRAAILSFVLAVSAPAGIAALPARMGGSCLAGAISAIVTVVLWPGRPAHPILCHALCRSKRDGDERRVRGRR